MGVLASILACSKPLWDATPSVCIYPTIDAREMCLEHHIFKDLVVSYNLPWLAPPNTYSLSLPTTPFTRLPVKDKL
jgi:hypothetical protein